MWRVVEGEARVPAAACRSASPPVRSVTSSTVVQKQVGQTIVQLPQRQAAVGDLVPARVLAVAAAAARAMPVGVERAAHLRRPRARRRARPPRGRAARRVACGSSASTSAPRSLPTSTRKRWPSSSSSSVSARSKPAADLRPGVHRDAEAGAAGLAAVDRDEERVAPAGLVVGVDVSAADEDAVLDRDGVQVAAAHADERVAAAARVRPAAIVELAVRARARLARAAARRQEAASTSAWPTV